MNSDVTLPIELQFEDGIVRMIGAQIERQHFAEPFLTDSLTTRLQILESSPSDLAEDAALVRRFQTRGGDPRICLSELDEFLGAHHRPPHQNLVFIFHMARSGSTLLSQMFSTLPNTFVLSEPTIINRILDPLTPFLSRLQRDSVLRAAVNSLCSCGPVGTQHVIIKFRSWNVLFAETLLELFPLAKTCFVHRDSAEVWASVSKSPPGWLRSKETNPLADTLGFGPEEMASWSEVEFIANVLARFCAAAGGLHLGPEGYIDYPWIVPDFEHIASRAFGVDLSGHEIDRAIIRARTYSKAPAGSVHFQSDGEAKRAVVSADQRAIFLDAVEPIRRRLGAESPWSSIILS